MYQLSHTQHQSLSVLVFCMIGLNCLIHGNVAPPEIPVIDISVFTGANSTREERKEVARMIGEACERIGFFAIINHGVPTDAVTAAWNVTKDFFDLPIEQKSEVVPIDEGFAYPYGYENIENLKRGKQKHIDNNAPLEDSSTPDLKETFSLGPKFPHLSGMPARRFPSKPSQLRRAYEEYYEVMVQLARQLLQAFALALDLPEDWFEDKMDRHMCALRVLNYPDLKDPTPGQIRAGAHTDYGALTILKSGGLGLQVKPDDGNFDDQLPWIDVPYLADAFVINLGDLMARWTNDKWMSTLHRVVLPEDYLEGSNRRQSMAFFVNVNSDTLVSKIPSCESNTEYPNYEPVLAGEYLKMKHMASMGVEQDEL